MEEREMVEPKTTIAVYAREHARLDRLRRPLPRSVKLETFNTVIERLLDEHETKLGAERDEIKT